MFQLVLGPEKHHVELGWMGGTRDEGNSFPLTECHSESRHRSLGALPKGGGWNGQKQGAIHTQDGSEEPQILCLSRH